MQSGTAKKAGGIHVHFNIVYQLGIIWAERVVVITPGQRYPLSLLTRIPLCSHAV